VGYSIRWLEGVGSCWELADGEAGPGVVQKVKGAWMFKRVTQADGVVAVVVDNC